MTTADYYSMWGVAARKSMMMPADALRAQRFMLQNFGYNHRADGVRIVEHAGWHFTYLGDTEFARTKIQSFAHTETNTPEVIGQLDVERSIANGDSIYHHEGYRFTAVELNEYFPATVLNNPGKYSKYILSNAAKQAQDLLPS